MSLILLPCVGAAADAFYINNGTVNRPQVDAVNFVNRGLFQAFGGALSYEPSDTLNYTNKVGTFSGSGTMRGSPGFILDTASTTTGLSTMAASFFNDNGALVEADDPGAQFLNNFFCSVATVDPSYLLVSATNIIIKGGTSGSPKASLRVGSNGELKLEGKHIDISRSGLEVLPVWDELFGSFLIPTNLFQPDVAIYDQYWGRTNFDNNYSLFSDELWDGQTATAPFAPVQFVNGLCGVFGGASGFSLLNPVADSYINVDPTTFLTVTITNQDGSTSMVTMATNITKGAVFVGGPSGASVQIGFTPAFNNFDTAGVLLSLQLSNVVTTLLEPAYIFVQDTLGSGGTTGLLANIIGCPPLSTFRPANYDVERLRFSPGGAGNNGYPEPNFFLDSGASDPSVLTDLVVSTRITNGEFSAYSAFLDNIVSRPPLVAGGTVTNLPGRIRISSDTLDMSKTRLRGEGQIIIQTSHLISSSNAVVDCENLSFDLNSTNGNLKVQNLSKQSVDRLRGNIYMWSAVWSNTAVVILNNFSLDTNTPPVATPAPITNTITISLYTLMLDATALTTTQPVTVHDFVTHSTNTVVSDNMTVVQSMLIEGQSLTLDGSITIPGAIPPANPILDPGGFCSFSAPLRDWTFTNAPNLLFFTNHGTFSIANEAHFGDDRATPYATLVNTGTISAASLQLNSDFFQNNGSLQTVGPLTMQSTTAKLENGSSSSGGDSQFLSGTLKFNNYHLTVNGGVYFGVTNALFDTGGGAGNTFNVQNGFNLQLKPPTGDLLGTALQTIAPNVPSIEIDHTWAGEDRGASAVGYSNNVALGKLILSSQSPDPLFFFSGAGLNNGLYVDLLDISKLDTNYLNQMQIDPSLVIYYAAANLGFTPPLTNGAVQEAEEFLDGQFGGHLRWVRDFAGPNSSVDVLINGQTVKVNRALRNSRIIDSDGDGTPNFFDFTPFDTVLMVQIVGAGTVTPDYNGQTLALGQTYTVTAKAGAGSVFSNWTGGIVSDSPQLTFTMQTNLMLVANFAAHPFAATVGSYNGLFYDSNDVERASSGTFTATTTAGGNYSGRLQMGLSRYPFSGHFNLAGAATNMITRRSTNWLTLVLQMDLAANEHMGGTVSDGTWLAELQADRAVVYAGLNASPFAGNYTLLFPGSGDPGNTGAPLGDGYGAVTIDRSGRITLHGALADGEKLAQTAAVSRSGRWPLYDPVYRGQGQLLGWLVFASTVDEDVGGTVNWIKPPQAAARFYPAGFNLEVRATGSAYTPAPMLSFSNGVVTLMGGHLAAGIVSNVAIDSNHRVTGDNGLKLTLQPAQGWFNGSVLDLATGRRIYFNGALLQKQNAGHGFFLGTDQSGSVDFVP